MSEQELNPNSPAVINAMQYIFFILVCVVREPTGAISSRSFPARVHALPNMMSGYHEFFHLPSKKKTAKLRCVLMKALSFILAALAIPALSAQAADKAGVMESYFPTAADGSMLLRTGAQVRAVPDAKSLEEPLRKVNERIAQIPQDDKVAFIRDFNAMQRPSYNAAIWPDRKDYDAFLAAWDKTQVVPVTQVAMGLQKDGDTWRVLSVTVDSQTKRQIPLTISALRYDADKNEWISNDGRLTPKDYSVPDSSVFGAQTGTEWTLKKETPISTLVTSLRVSRTTDGKFVYVAYIFDERATVTGNSIAHGDYLLRFPVSTPGADVGKPGQR